MMPSWYLILTLITPGHETVTIRSVDPMTRAECLTVGEASAARLSVSLPDAIVAWTCERAGEVV